MFWYYEFDTFRILRCSLSISLISFKVVLFRVPKILSFTLIFQQGVFEEKLSKLQKKIDDMKRTQAQCEETIRLKKNFMVIKLLS